MFKFELRMENQLARTMELILDSIKEERTDRLELEVLYTILEQDLTMMLHRIAHMENKCDELRRLQAQLTGLENEITALNNVISRLKKGPTFCVGFLVCIITSLFVC